MTIEVINQYQIKETGLIGFWLGYYGYSDYMSLALFITKLLSKYDFKYSYEIKPYLTAKIPKDYFFDS